MTKQVQKGFKIIVISCLLMLVYLSFLIPNANAASKWSKENGQWTYEVNGVKQKGWIKDKNKWYYLNASGTMATGWIKEANKWYYLSANGAMATGWVKDANKWYFLNANGAMATGWVKDANKWYFLNANGAMATGWIEVEEVKYFLNSDGTWAATAVYEDDKEINGLKDNTYDTKDPSSYVGLWVYEFEEGKQSIYLEPGYYITLSQKEDSEDEFYVEVLEHAGIFTNENKGVVDFSTGTGVYEFMSDANENSGKVEIELASDGITYRKEMYTDNAGRFDFDVEVKLKVHRQSW